MGRPKGSKNKKTLEKMKKEALKRTPKKVLIICCIVLFIGLFIWGFFNKDLILSYFNDDTPEIKVVGDVAYLVEEGTITEEVKVTFLELFGNNSDPQIGDSVFIECGDIDILIDAGKQGSGSNTVVPYLEEHVEDNVLELVVITHSDADHLGGMLGLSSSYGALEIPGFTYLYLIDYGYEHTSNLHKNYIELRDSLVNDGTVNYSMHNVFGNEQKDYAASRFYLGVDTYLDFLDYKTYAIDDEDDPNERSVACLLTHYENRMLFCGDAEKNEEKYLLDLNIGKVDLFKANHHGSPTSNTVDFLDNIDPEYIVITSNEENEYELPKKVIVARFNEYTENVYATFSSGNITFVSKNNDLTVSSTRTLIPVDESEWYLRDDPDNPR